ncbi:hypothetical protein [Fortiea contorta]|uniref:hypothetical protein n=1 Tax=Fortiea contorta TaxID=1892405 RepID=UPI0003495FF4|nr:hypothetical protein [Fortiea contorta]
MVKIKVYDLSPDESGKFINELNAWDMKTVYAGYIGWDRRYSRETPPVAQPEEPNTPIVDKANANLAQWMDSLEVQIKDLRKQFGISQ